MRNHLIYLNVGPGEGGEAAQAGARYSKRWKAYYTYGHHDHAPLKRWLPRQYHPYQNPPYLKINLVPETSFHKNLHKLFLPQDKWDMVRKHVYRKAGHRCEICGGRGETHPVECNEHWEFTHAAKQGGLNIQSLARLEALCPDCHACVHFGSTAGRGKALLAYKQFQLVNGWDAAQTDAANDAAVALWRERSRHQWTFDLSILQEFGIDTLIIPSAKAARMPPVLGVRVEWAAPAFIPPTAPVFASFSRAPRMAVAAKKPLWLAYAKQALASDCRYLRAWWARKRFPRRHRWFWVACLGLAVLAAHALGFTKWPLEQLSLGLRYAYWYVEGMK